jgi:hypothetical protein
MKKNILFFSCLLVTLLCACKKDEVKDPVPNVVGYWKGNVPSTNAALAFVNKANGTGRMYAGNANDTATATEKYDGTWKLDGRFFSAKFIAGPTAGTDTFYLQAVMTEPFEIMSGFVSTDGFFAIPFEAIKQP